MDASKRSRDGDPAGGLDRRTLLGGLAGAGVLAAGGCLEAPQMCGRTGELVPRHVFGPPRGAGARQAPANLRPVGTGPYRIVEFRPGDVIRAEAEPRYHAPDRPVFDQLEVKGGGDAASAGGGPTLPGAPPCSTG